VKKIQANYLPKNRKAQPQKKNLSSPKNIYSKDSSNNQMNDSYDNTSNVSDNFNYSRRFKSEKSDMDKSPGSFSDMVAMVKSQADQIKLHQQ
jgi:hypothetical protein